MLYDGRAASLIDFGLSFRASTAREFSLDRDGLASVLLFLLYSDQSRIRPGVKGSWREELLLPTDVSQLLEDLFNEEYPWEGVAQIRGRVQQAFAACSAASSLYAMRSSGLE